LHGVAAPARERNKRGEGERLRTALLDAASELLAESPDVEQLSVRAVTARAGVTPTALYLHFADKDDLARAVKKRFFGELSETLRDAQPEGKSPYEQLRTMARTYLRYAREQPGHYAILFHTAKSKKRSRRTPNDVREAGMETFKVLVDAVELCLDGRGDSFEAATVLWLALHGRAQVQATMPWFPLPDEERYIDLLIERNVRQRFERTI
jgi:AcrR family transcriptional regulator